jgi:hypothetical protein
MIGDEEGAEGQGEQCFGQEFWPWRTLLASRVLNPSNVLQAFSIESIKHCFWCHVS